MFFKDTERINAGANENLIYNSSTVVLDLLFFIPANPFNLPSASYERELKPHGQL